MEKKVEKKPVVTFGNIVFDDEGKKIVGEVVKAKPETIAAWRKAGLVE